MRNSTGKKIITLIIGLSLLGTQVLLPLQASADNQFLNYDNPNKDGNNPYKISLSSVINSRLLTQVVGCTGIVNKVAKVSTEFVQDLLLRKSERLARKALKKSADAADKIVDTAQKVVTSTAVTAPGIPSADVGARTQKLAENIASTAHKLAQNAKELVTDDDIDAALKRNEDKLKQANFREECINGIAVQLAKNQLTAMTKYTMNWINTGFKGGPGFVQNVNSFMDDITDNILERETAFFKNPANADALPYGRDFARSQINASKLKDNYKNALKQDLTNYLSPGATIDSYSTNFSQGGEDPWEAWLALTQHPQDNPLGFSLIAGEHLANTENDAVADAHAEIDRGDGFLGQKDCVEWQLKDKDGNLQYNKDGTPLTTTTKRTAENDECIDEVTVTPGSTIKTKIDTYVNTPERQLELVKTMNDALNALFAALLSKFENQGLSSLSSNKNNFSIALGGGSGAGQTSGGNTLGSSGSISSDGSFDLTKDLGNTYVNGKIVKKGIIQIQQDYLDNLKKLTALLPSVIPALGKLDYCIPGPNQNWEANSQDAIIAYLSSIDNTVGTPPIDPNTLNTSLTAYKDAIDTTYGALSPMQDPTVGNGSYLKMSGEGLALTKNLVTDAEDIATAKEESARQKTETILNITKLNAIKVKVNAIITAAQGRRARARAEAGLPVIKSACLATEKVTYLDNGVIQ